MNFWEVFFLILFVMATTFFVTESIYSDVDKRLVEYGYFEGQKDAVENNVRIYKDMKGYWHWERTCWDDGTAVSFDPSGSK